MDFGLILFSPKTPSQTKGPEGRLAPCLGERQGGQSHGLLSIRLLDLPGRKKVGPDRFHSPCALSPVPWLFRSSRGSGSSPAVSAVGLVRRSWRENGRSHLARGTGALTI